MFLNRLMFFKLRNRINPFFNISRKDNVTINELRSVARGRNIDVYQSMSREQL